MYVWAILLRSFKRGGEVSFEMENIVLIRTTKGEGEMLYTNRNKEQILFWNLQQGIMKGTERLA